MGAAPSPFPAGASAQPQPLYSVTQAMAALKRLRPVAYGEIPSPHAALAIRFLDAGHILVGDRRGEGRGRTLVFPAISASPRDR